MLEYLAKQKQCDNYPIIVERWCKSITQDVLINTKYNLITFKLQSGPRKVLGSYGCDIDTIIKSCQIILSGLQKRIPCKQNEEAIFHLLKAYELMKERHEDRVKRDVEGTNKE